MVLKRCLIWISQILAKCDGQFFQRWFCSARSPCITEAKHWSHPSLFAMKQSYFEILELVPAVSAKLSWNFIRHLAAAVPLLKTGNDISPICRYIIEVWLVLMAYLPYIWQIWYGIIMICRHMQNIWRNMHDVCI